MASSYLCYVRMNGMDCADFEARRWTGHQRSGSRQSVKVRQRLLHRHWGHHMNTLVRNSDALFNDLLLPVETIAIRREVRQIAQEILGPIAHAINTTSESVEAFPREAFSALSAAGI